MIIESQGFSHPPTIELSQCRLRPVRRGDATAIFEYLSVPDVTERTSYPEVTMELVESMIDKFAKRWATGELSKWGITPVDDDETVVGLCGFNDWSAVHRWAEIAYDLDRSRWGQGLMSQAVTAVIDWAFENTIVERIHAYVRVDNSRSSKLLEHLGFEEEGRMRSFRFRNGQPHDFNVYSLLRSDRSRTGRMRS
jgi:ribosomal-protein-alanine N-acetyltransferase